MPEPTTKTTTTGEHLAEILNQVAETLGLPAGESLAADVRQALEQRLQVAYRAGFGDGYIAAVERLDQRAAKRWLKGEERLAVIARGEAKAVREAFGDELDKRFPEQED